jgi:hypothetical protein
MSIQETKAKLATALAKYREIVHISPAPDVRAASASVKALQKQLAAEIAEGANPCPGCGETPHGMEHQFARGLNAGVDYEIGCLSCKPFQHTDGTTRQYGVRGGIMPQHAVEAWNAGPDFWLKVAS